MFPFARRAQRPAAEEPLFDAAFRQRLERLAIRTRQTLAWRAIGEHRSPQRSPSREFVDFRAYSQGEDLRYLDWNTYARLGELVTRLGEVSTELTVHILLDTSASMNWGDPNKLRYAKRLAAALGYITLWHFDRLVVAPFDRRVGEPFGPRRGRAAVPGLFLYLERLPAGGETDLERALGGYAARQGRRGLLILVSDLLSGDPGPALRPFLERRWEVILFHTLDAQEVEPAYAGDLRLHDVEDQDRRLGLRVAPDDETLRRYRAAFDAWLRGIEDWCAGHRVGYLRVLTAWPFETLTLRFLLEGGFLGHPSDRRAAGSGAGAGPGTVRA
ncbi:MAG: DUF58 domain-containing protein [Chloroflexota bacterium]|nr:DUF58 domain-containing protein [Chloroflexota bacterium]